MKNSWSKRFPIFQRHPDLVYLDSAATTQRLDKVIDTMHEFSIAGNANVHKGVYKLSSRATNRYEEVREKIARFIHANGPENIGFTKSTTEAINIVARGYLESRLTKGDNVIVSIIEHHANFLPWQEVCKKIGAELRILPLDSEGKLSFDSFDKLIDSKTRFVALTHISNTLGRINPIKEICNKCREKDLPILLDAAQSAGLHPLDVNELNCDFLAFSGHKLFGPMGTGILYASDRFKDAIEPLIVGGGMIQSVSKKVSTYRKFPYNLEAGTPNVPGILGLGAAINFLTQLDRDEARQHIAWLVRKLIKGLSDIREIYVLPYFDEESGIVSFTIKGIHPHDVSGYLSRDNIAVRTGMHCTQPLLDSLDLDATTRVSFSIYNHEEDVDKLITSLKNLIDFWK